MFADRFQANSRSAFNDQFIVDMSDDETVPEGFHGVAEDVPADGLNNVFHEFWPVGFDALPFLCGSYTFIGDGFPTELIDTDAGLYVGKSSAGGELNKEHSTLIKEADAADLRWNALCDSGFDGVVHVPPERSNHGIRGTPGVYQRLEFFFRQAHFEGTHGFLQVRRTSVKQMRSKCLFPLRILLISMFRRQGRQGLWPLWRRSH